MSPVRRSIEKPPTIANLMEALRKRMDTASASFMNYRTAGIPLCFFLSVVLCSSPSAQTLPNARRLDRLLQAGHTNLIQTLAFSPDGKWLASGGYDKTVVVWNAATGDEHRKLTGHTAEITQLAFSPDDKHLASAGSDGSVRVWDYQTGGTVYALNLRGQVEHLAYSSDGMMWAAGVHAAKQGSTVRLEIHDAATGKLVRSIPTNWQGATAMVITSSGLLIAAGNSVDVWTLGSGHLVKSYPVSASALSADGRSMARVEVAPQATVVVSDVATGQPRRSIRLRNWSDPVSLSADGETIAVLDTSKSEVTLWSVATGAEVSTISGEKAIGSTALVVVAFSPDGKVLAAAPYAGSSIKSWDVTAGRELHTFYGQDHVQGIAVSPDGRSLVAGSQAGLSVWEVTSGKRIATLWNGPVNYAVFSRDGRWLAANTGGQFAGETLKVWDTKSRALVADFTFGGGGTPVAWIAFGGHGSPLTKTGPFTRSWEFTRDGQTHTVWSGPYPMAISPDGKLLATQFFIGNLLDIWDMASARKLTTLAAHPISISALAFSADGRWMVTAGGETSAGRVIVGWGVKVWEVATWTERWHLTFSATTAPCATFSPDSQQLAVQKAWDLIDLLDVNRGASVGTFTAKDPRPQHHQFSPGNLAFSPDGTLLLQGVQNGIRVWKLQIR